MKKNELPLFPISTVARILDISVHTLRLYEREGLIIPFRKETGHRLYSNADIERLRCIRESINQKKISIEGIKTIYSFIPCWSIKDCSNDERINCPAFINHSNPCWSFKHKNNVCSLSVCRDCNVYRNFSDCKSIKENIAELTTSKHQ
jgi:MerR family transcriptional regulator/heat shock protein HspR